MQIYTKVQGEYSVGVNTQKISGISAITFVCGLLRAAGGALLRFSWSRMNNKDIGHDYFCDHSSTMVKIHGSLPLFSGWCKKKKVVNRVDILKIYKSVHLHG